MVVIYMKKIVVCCAMGLTTSMLMKKIEDYYEKNEKDVTVAAMPIEKAMKPDLEADVVLLGPQIRYELENFQKKHPDIPSGFIPLQAYGTMDGEKVAKFAEEVFNNFHEKN